MNDEKEVKLFLATLNDDEKKAFEIAQSHLETSFDVEKCIYYLKWKSKK